MKEVIDFFRRLHDDNTREWFDAHRAEWTRVKGRFADFTGQLIGGIASFDPEVRGLRPQDCTYRIARDTRFSPDKSPYKTYIGAYIAPKGAVKMMSQILNSAVFPGIQGGPLEHVIAAKAVAFGEALEPAYKEYQTQVQKNAAAMAAAFVERGYKIVSGGTDNHLMLVDLRTKFPELTGKLAEKCLVAADITTNKNMVPFDSRSPFQTSGLRFGTPAITTRGLKEDKMDYIVGLIDRVLHDPENEANIAAVRKDVNALMADYPLFAW